MDIFAGHGVFATAALEKGAFIAEYRGELISISEADRRELLYSDENRGNFLYRFEHQKMKLW